MTEVVIVSAVRTAIGKIRGALSEVRPDDMAAVVIKEVVQRAGVDPNFIEEVYMGCANQAGEDNRNVARMGALLAGLPQHVAAVTVNRLCASGMNAVNQAARAIKAGEGDIFVAGGVESMTRAPYSMSKNPTGLGPAIAGIALGITGNDYRVPAFIAAGFSLISILLTIFWFQETYSPDKPKTDIPNESIFTKITKAFRNPLVGLLLILMFVQHLVFGSFEQFIPLFTLRRLGMDGASNAILFVFVGILLVLIQGKYIGPLSRRFGEINLIKFGLASMAVGLMMTAVTPQVPVNWYNKAELIASFEETANTDAENIGTHLPDDTSNGWLGLGWILVAMIPAAFGGGVLSPSINSLITKSSSPDEIGTALGVSSAFVSAANAITPLIGGALFQFLGTTPPFFIGGIALLLLLGYALSQLKPQPVMA